MPRMNPSRSNPSCVVNCAIYAKDGQRSDIHIEDVSEALEIDDGSFVWIGLYEPDDVVLALLQEEFGLHDLAIEDAQKAHQRPKVESYGKSLFVVASTAQQVDNRIAYGETHIFLGPRYLVTVRHGASLSYAPARARIERDPEMLALGPFYALYAVLDAIVDNYLPLVNNFKQTLLVLEKDIVKETFDRRIVTQLYDLKRELTYMRVAVTPMQDVLSQLMRNASFPIPEEVRIYLRDVHDHSLRTNETIDVLRDMLGTALSVNQALVTLKQGEVVKRLAGWAALLAAPTLVASWYGMNFDAMPELHGAYSYLILIGVVGVVVTGLYAYFRKINWL